LNDTLSQIEDLYRYNEWANARVFQLCLDLTNAQLDEQREMGFGSLRNTLFHILTAEQIWLERWQVVPWRAFPTDSQGMSLDDIEAQLKQIAQARQQLINAERSDKWNRVVNYKDSRGVEHSEPLRILLLHVANHGTYHRAQALNYLKHLGRTLPVGIDYTLYKLARPSVEQAPESIERFKEVGLEVASAAGWQPRWDRELIEQYTDYTSWANGLIFSTLADADDETIDRDFGIGMGTIRKALTHMLEVDDWWISIWNEGGQEPKSFGRLSLQQLQERSTELHESKRKYIASLDDKSALRVLTARPAGIPYQIRAVESLVQLCCHGTHHRAQLVNMLRQSGRAVPGSDLIVWWRNRT
jgi:uncharacterized damage-inducible protein DinB